MALRGQALEAGIEGQRLARGEAGVELDTFGQVSQGLPGMAPLRGIGAQHLKQPCVGPDKSKHHLDLRRLSRAVMTDQRHHFAGRQVIAEVVDHLAPPIGLAHAVQDHRCIVHGSGLSEWGNIRGALSMTPPGSTAGKRLWAKRRICTAGLVISIRACGAVHMTLSTMSFGR